MKKIQFFTHLFGLVYSVMFLCVFIRPKRMYFFSVLKLIFIML